MDKDLIIKKDNIDEILLIGIGNTGMKVLLEMLSRKNSGIQCLGVDTEWTVLKEYGIWKRLLLGKNTTYGYRALSIEEAYKATQEEETEIRTLFNKYKEIFVTFEISRNNLTTLGILYMLGKIAKMEKVSITGLFFQLREDDDEIVSMVKVHMNKVILLCENEHMRKELSLEKKTYDASCQELCDFSEGMDNDVFGIDGLIKKANDIVEQRLFSI